MSFGRKAQMCCVALAVGIATALPVGNSSIAAPRSVEGPYLDPRTGSYFELSDRLDMHHQGPNWREANSVARSQTYKGRRGRLAVIHDQETLTFISKKFDLRHATWTGLRYFCQFRKLVWSGGTTQPLQSMAGMWAPQWHRTNITCSSRGGEMEYMPVYITGTGSGPSRLQASGQNKRFYNVLVEYPKPVENSTSNQADAANQTTQEKAQ